MMPLGAPSISKYGSLVRPGAQIVALRAHCAWGAPLGSDIAELGDIEASPGDKRSSSSNSSRPFLKHHGVYWSTCFQPARQHQ